MPVLWREGRSSDREWLLIIFIVQTIIHHYGGSSGGSPRFVTPDKAKALDKARELQGFVSCWTLETGQSAGDDLWPCLHCDGSGCPQCSSWEPE